MATLYLENAFCEEHYIWWCDRVTWKNFCWPIVPHIEMHEKGLKGLKDSEGLVSLVGLVGWGEGEQSSSSKKEDMSLGSLAPSKPCPCNLDLTIFRSYSYYNALLLCIRTEHSKLFGFVRPCDSVYLIALRPYLIKHAHILHSIHNCRTRRAALVSGYVGCATAVEYCRARKMIALSKPSPALNKWLVKMRRMSRHPRSRAYAAGLCVLA